MLLAVRINEWLYQGSQPPNEITYIGIKNSGVTHVLSTNAENPSIDVARKVFGEDNVLHIKWRDDLGEKPVKDFKAMYHWLQNIPPDGIILSHCSAGVSRSVLASVWLLVCREHLEPYAAFNAILTKEAGAMGYHVPAYRLSLLRAMREILKEREV